MKLKTKIFYTLFVLSVVLNIGLSYESLTLKKKQEYSADKVENIYNQNLSLFSQHCYDLEQNLSKFSACNHSEEAIRILTDIVDDSGSAVASLSTLPLFPEYVAKLNRYLNHVSDYSKFVISECSYGKGISDNCRTNMQAFSESVASVNKVLNELSVKLRETPMDWSVLMNNAIIEADLFDNELSSSMESIQNNSINYPTLIYDGPFSDSVVNKKITEKESLELTQNAAVTAFSEFIQISGHYRMTDATLCHGNIDTWAITLEKDGIYYYGNVSVKSGEVISFLCSDSRHSTVLSREQAIKRASDFLSENGYTNMIPQYCQIADGNATINFVYSENNILIYPDMVKVRVDMEDGTVNGFEGFSYYANHANERNLSFDGASSLEDVKLLLPDNCTLLSSSKALIPTDGGNELLVYEFRIKSDDSTFVLYFDAKTQKEVKIFKILYSENGEFVV